MRGDLGGGEDGLTDACGDGDETRPLMPDEDTHVEVLDVQKNIETRSACELAKKRKKRKDRKKLEDRKLARREMRE